MALMKFLHPATVLATLLLDVVVPAHVNLVPCPGRGNNLFEINCIVPDLIDRAPPLPITIVYPDGSRVQFGNELGPETVSVAPSIITWKADPYCLYTLSKSDPDAFSRQNSSIAPINHWLVVNIPGSDVRRGNVVQEYLGAEPPEGTGLHRYIFLVFEQKSPINLSSPTNLALKQDNAQFEIRNYAKENNLGNPIAGNFYNAQYSDFLAEKKTMKLVSPKLNLFRPVLSPGRVTWTWNLFL